MMIKNEEKYLNKTLSSLGNLMNDIDSELIVLDTGSTDNSVSIARKYTDKVYFSEWNNNFGDMRNKSISYAKGDWVLILDADEELIDYSNLKNFFSTELYKKYNCASIELKSIYNEDESSYNIGTIYRLFRNEKGFRYEGSIHEQPIYKTPAYNSIATFKHYGYMFKNEEIRQLKNKRNIELLLIEVEDKPNDPYMNYQLGKSYMIFNKYEDAAFYIEKAQDIYKKFGNIPPYVSCDLANLYISNGDFIKCEKLCINYIKYDSKNIDIYYYLAISQKQLGKYKESLKSYEKYLYYIENYKLSTQYKDIQCHCNTMSCKENSEIEIIDIYYKLEMYEKLLSKVKFMSKEQLKSIYYIVFIALYKLDKKNEIIEWYNDICHDELDRNNFRNNLEFAMKKLKEYEQNELYKLMSNINDNYGTLNKLRVDKKVSIEQYKTILQDENELYYSEVLYYGFKDGIQFEEMLDGLSYLKIQQFIDYIVLTKRDCILDLYKYLYSVPSTMNNKKIHIYSALSKSLFLYGKLNSEKYETLFLMYIKYRYDCMKLIYTNTMCDEDLMYYIKDKEDYFVIDINIIQKLKNNDELEYIKRMKKLLRQNKHYESCIRILINKFEKEIKENNEMKNLKIKYKSLIEKSINNGNIKEATSMIKEYESMFEQEAEIYNMKGIISIFNNELSEAELLFKQASLLENDNINTMFNIAYLKEILGEKEEAIKFYNKIILASNDESLIFEANEKIKLISDR